jgi:hypothetical protein
MIVRATDDPAAFKELVFPFCKVIRFATRRS